MTEKILNVLKEDALTIAIVIGLVIAYLFLRTPGDDFGSLGEIETRLTDGNPTVVSFYSNTCSICLISKPRVDQLERDLTDQAELLRLDVRSEPGNQLAYRWQVTGVPAFFVFDGAGELVHRQAGAPDVAAIKDAVATSLRPTAGN